MNILQDLLYSLMYYVGYVEIFMNKFIRIFMISDSKEETIYLVNTHEMEVEIIDDLNSDITMDYNFGIVEKSDEKKGLCHYTFDELDTDDIQTMFHNQVDAPFFSVSVVHESTNYDIDITNINYFFKGNKLFFREHIIYIMNKYHNVNLEPDSNYEVSIVDHMCNLISFSHEEYVVLTPIDDKLYRIKHSK